MPELGFVGFRLGFANPRFELRQIMGVMCVASVRSHFFELCVNSCEAKRDVKQTSEASKLKRAQVKGRSPHNHQPGRQRREAAATGN